MIPEVCQILDLVYAESPQEPDWAAVKTLIHTFDNPEQVQLELIRVMWLYAEDPAAFEELIYREQQS